MTTFVNYIVSNLYPGVLGHVTAIVFSQSDNVWDGGSVEKCVKH